MKYCLKCYLANPDNAQSCDCGFNFKSNTMEKSYLYEAEFEKSKLIDTGVFNQFGSLGCLFAIAFIIIYAYQLITGDPNPIPFYLVILIALIGFGFYLSSPLSFKFEKKGMKLKYLFGIQIKYSWKNVIGVSHYGFGLTHSSIIVTKYSIIFLNSYGMPEYYELIRRLIYWLNKSKKAIYDM